MISVGEMQTVFVLNVRKNQFLYMYKLSQPLLNRPVPYLTSLNLSALFKQLISRLSCGFYSVYRRYFLEWYICQCLYYSSFTVFAIFSLYMSFSIACWSVTSISVNCISLNLRLKMFLFFIVITADVSVWINALKQMLE